MKQFINQFTLQLLVAGLFLMAVTNQAMAWDTEPDATGKYDKDFDRPTHFPDWEQPLSIWPTTEMYLVCARLGANGPRLQNYEVAVYDSIGNLRHCHRSQAKDEHRCVLTVCGNENDVFHCQVIYGDFDNPTIVDVPETFGFKSNDMVGTNEAPFWLTVPGRTFLSEMSTELPADETNANVTVIRTIKANEWGTICLPFAMTAEQVQTAFGADVELADFTGCDVTYEEDEETVKSINVKFVDATAIEANHPYIIKVSEPIAEFEVDGVDIQAEEASVDCDRIGKGTKKDPYKYNSFIGNYKNNFFVPEQMLFLSGGNFWYSTGNTKMMAYRGYFDFYDVLPEVEGASARITMSVADDDQPLGIAEHPLGTASPADAVYDLQGRRVSSSAPKRGLYIVQGKKVIFK